MKETKKEAGFIADGMTWNQIKTRIREVPENISKYFFWKKFRSQAKNSSFRCLYSVGVKTLSPLWSLTTRSQLLEPALIYQSWINDAPWLSYSIWNERWYFRMIDSRQLAMTIYKIIILSATSARVRCAGEIPMIDGLTTIYSNRIPSFSGYQG